MLSLFTQLKPSPSQEPSSGQNQPNLSPVNASTNDGSSDDEDAEEREAEEVIAKMKRLQDLGFVKFFKS
jgi:hypothetical protein